MPSLSNLSLSCLSGIHGGRFLTMGVSTSKCDLVEVRILVTTAVVGALFVWLLAVEDTRSFAVVTVGDVIITTVVLRVTIGRCVTMIRGVILTVTLRCGRVVDSVNCVVGDGVFLVVDCVVRYVVVVIANVCTGIVDAAVELVVVTVGLVVDTVDVATDVVSYGGTIISG